MEFLIGFLIYNLIAFGIIMTGFWSINDEELKKLIEDKNAEEGTDYTVTSLFWISLFLAWFLFPLFLFGKKSE